MHVAHAALRRHSTRSKVAAASTASGGAIASGEESVAEVTAEAAGRWQTVSKKKKSRGGKNKSGNVAAGQRAANSGSNESILADHIDAVVAETTKRLHQQQTAWRAPGNCAAGQQQGQ